MTNNKKEVGRLEVICGSMFSGKSKELINRLNRATFAKKRVLACKSDLDTRYEVGSVISHDRNKYKAYAVASAEQILQLVGEHHPEVVGIDEIQFFSPSIIPMILSLVKQGKRVIVAGLDLDFRGEPFGSTPLLMALADGVIKLHAVCSICGADAQFTQRIINGSPAHYDDPLVLVGTREEYQARCRNCYEIDKQPLLSLP